MDYVYIGYLISIRKVLIIFNKGTFTWISSVQGEKDILNGMTCMVTAKPWFINGIKTLYGRFFCSCSSIQYAIFISLLQCICFSVYTQSQNSRYFKMKMMQIRLHGVVIVMFCVSGCVGALLRSKYSNNHLMFVISHTLGQDNIMYAIISKSGNLA